MGKVYKTGKVFDASWKRGQTPTTTPLPVCRASSPAGTRASIGMKVGGRRELIIPPSLAYKNQAQAKIPANSTLVFVVDLHCISASGNPQSSPLRRRARYSGVCPETPLSR